MAKILVTLIIVSGVLIAYTFRSRTQDLPKFELDEWWGPQDGKTKQDTSIRPFTIKFDEKLDEDFGSVVRSAIDTFMGVVRGRPHGGVALLWRKSVFTRMVEDLKSRLRSHRKWNPPLEGIGFEYGFNSDNLDPWLNYWAEKYNFSEREKYLNQYPHYKTNIQGLDIHFIRVKPQAPPELEVVPLLLLHGWPGSVREFYEAIPLLTKVDKDRNFAIEVIVASLPGYGYSDAAVRPGLSAAKIAVVFRNLMHRLGFQKYYLQGGDFGALTMAAMVSLFPEEILGYHTNMGFSVSRQALLYHILGSIYPPLIVDKQVEDRLYPLSRLYADMLEESGYFHIQATKPDTIGIGLSDSPAGLLAYVLEKFSTGAGLACRSLPDGGLYSTFTKEQLLDNLMIYWSTNCMTTAVRLYAETFIKESSHLEIIRSPTTVPTWVIQAKNDFYNPPVVLRLKYHNLVNITVLDDGGHFLALEKPEVFSQDVIKAIVEFRNVHNDKKIS